MNHVIQWINWENSMFVRSFVIVSILLFSQAYAEEIEEAPDFDEPVAQGKSATDDNTMQAASYLLYQTQQFMQHYTPWRAQEEDSLEFNVRLTKKFNKLSFFTDISSLYIFSEKNTLNLNQFGIRFSKDQYLITAGLDRSLKTPGLLISPSDFIYRNSILPGAREQRQGVWLLRIAKVKPKSTLEAVYLANLNVDEHGLPDSDSEINGVYTSYFRQLEKTDFAINVANIDDNNLLGGFAQKFIYKLTKLYGEYAYKEGANRDNIETLVGISLEGFDILSAKLEWYWQKNKQTPSPPIPGSPTFSLDRFFYLQNYIISGLTAGDLWRESSISVNYVSAMEKSLSLLVLRAEMPFRGQYRVGTSFSKFNNDMFSLSQEVVALDFRFSF